MYTWRFNGRVESVLGMNFVSTYLLLKWLPRLIGLRVDVQHLKHATTTTDNAVKDTPIRWPSILDFPGQSRFLTICPRKNYSSPRMPICPIFGSLSRICLTLLNCPSAAVCLRISGQNLTQILSVYMKKSLAAGAPPWIPLRELTMLPNPQVEPRWPAPAAFAPTTYAFNVHSGLRCPNYGHLTLPQCKAALGDSSSIPVIVTIIYISVA